MSITVQIMTIPGAPVEGTNPLPIFHNKIEVDFPAAPEFPQELREDLGNRTPVLPYTLQDRYSRRRVPLRKKAIVMENEFLRAVFWPEDGGRLHSLYDKKNGAELLMSNPVYQPGNLAIRNAWLSGGIEWNFGTLGHHARTCDSIFAAVLRDEQGEPFLRMYEYDRTKEALYQMDFYLPEGSPLLYSHVKLINPFDVDSTCYWWTNIAIPEDGATRVLSSTEMAIVLGADEGVTYEKVPEISLFPGKDLSYPHNATRGFDYFFQAPQGTKSAWEAGAYSDGLVFFDRSTAPLLYHKMFCWGNHAAGKHWQEYLSKPGAGYYIEIQGGIARSQVHDKLFPARSTIEWSQCFGGMRLDRAQLHQPSFAGANAYLGGYIDEAIGEEELLRLDALFARRAKLRMNESELVHMGSGWGALEQLRIAREGGRPFPESMFFPMASIGPEQYPWLALLEQGELPEEAPEQIPVSWMVSEKWLPLLEKSLQRRECWNALLHYGVMLAEMMDRTHTAVPASRWGRYPEFRARARKALERSVELCPSVWALRCLACLAKEENDWPQAEACYDRVFALDAAQVDFAFAAEYMRWLNEQGKYEKAWALYSSLPAEHRAVERVQINAAQAAVKLRRLDEAEEIFRREEYADIREGECSLTDIWFELCALKMAAERGIDDPQGEALEALIDEAWEQCPPPAQIDFRMSYDRKRKYRLEE
ncbi:MAG: DUF5107 domain-containing protein [Eubacteriales bacterium]|nr:DUF5107 domain-containing protein [Eubacteriales bacterium]